MTMQFFSKKNLVTAVKILLSISILWFLVHNTQIKITLLYRILHHPYLLIATTFTLLLMVVVSAWRWHVINASQGIDLGFVKTIMPTYLGTAFNYILPGAIGGDVVRIYYLIKRIHGKKSTMLLSVFFDRLFGLMGVLLLIGFIAISNLQTFYHRQELTYLLFLCGIMCAIVIAFFTCLMVAPQYIKPDVWLSKHFPERRWMRPIISLFESVRAFRVTKLSLIKCLAAAVAVQLLMVAVIEIISSMLGMPHIRFTDYAIAMGITQIISLIPITPGGIGIGEMVFANIVMLLNPGVSAGFATIYLVYRLISILTYLPSALFYIPGMILSRHKKIERATSNA